MSSEQIESHASLHGASGIPNNAVGTVIGYRGGRAKRAQCVQPVVMEDFAIGRELVARLPMRDAWLRAYITQHDAISTPIFATYQFPPKSPGP